MPISRNQRLKMLQTASRGWLDLKRLIDSIPDDALNRPNTIGTWSGKDLLAHIGNWEEEGIAIIERMDEGGPEQWPERSDGSFDAWNEDHVRPWRSRTLAEVKEYLEDVHFSLMDLAERSPNAKSEVVIPVTTEHYEKHLDDLLQLAPKPRT